MRLGGTLSSGALSAIQLASGAKAKRIALNRFGWERGL